MRTNILVLSELNLKSKKKNKFDFDVPFALEKGMTLKLIPIKEIEMEDITEYDCSRIINSD